MTDQSRRAFFRETGRKATEATINHLDTYVQRRAKRWVRPPHAIDELEFLTTCNRCGDCILACPHQVVFPLAARLGAAVAGTPALDLNNKGCHLCDDWPCVNACESSALKFPDKTAIDNKSSESIENTIPRIAMAAINTETCLAYLGPECGACASSCPIPDALTWNSEKPGIDSDNCVGCGLCRQTCIVNPKAIKISSLCK